ncbi:MAG: hypothetical protein [Bacteriophage sp.]|nr:MAG: hypothetical protein [Bacteriophage sp.]
MNLLTQNQSMTSLEIAELVGKRHDSVKRTIEILSSETDKRDAVISQPHSVDGIKSANGVITKLYVFSGEQGKRDSIIVVAQLCPEFTARLVDRWQELEQKEQFYIPQTYGDALQLCADQAKQLELQAPKVNFYDTLADKTTLMNATQVGQKFKMSAVKLNKLLVELDVYSTAIKRGKAFKQWFIDQGLGEMKQTELGYSQALFTPKGEQWIFEKFTSEGII